MCGICGVVHFTDEPVAPDALAGACDALRHRGPDHTGTWLEPGRGDSPGRVGLGATRLAVLDPSPSGHQPMHGGHGRFHLVFNGEIYNYREIRNELQSAGERFVTECDTEVVMAACARWGADALSRFNGMWALAFYDSQTRAGFLSRDRFGIKPLLYSSDASGLRFASELGALTGIGRFDRTIDRRAVVGLLQFGYIAHPSTIYGQAQRLPPGHYLTFNASGPGDPVRYYQLPMANREQDGEEDYTNARARLRRCLADAVVSRRVSDVPIGAFLSGGLDSSIIVRHLSAVIGRQVQTFSVGYAGQRSYDETRFARIVASRFGTHHRELVLTEGDVLDSIPPLLDHLGEPFGDSSIIPTALLSRFARQFVTVALSGDGGDELFGGYWRYLGHDALATYERLPWFLRRAIIEPLLDGMSSSKSSPLGNRIRQFRKLLRTGGDDFIGRHIAWSRILAPEAESILTYPSDADVCDRAVTTHALTATSQMPGPDSLNRILAFDVQHQLPADMLHKVDLAGMMHSLEVRVPFLDPEVVELAMAMPSSFKIDRGRRKRILVDAYRGHLPDKILDRPKQGFEVPIGEFFRGPLAEMFRDTVTRDVVDSFGFLSYDAIEGVYRDHADRRAEHADLLFALLSLCWWQTNTNKSVC